MSLIAIHVPDIGDFDAVTVIELLVKPGDAVVAEQSLITVESDKASMEIPSSHAGVVREIPLQLGDKIRQGSVVLMLEVASASQPTLRQASVQALSAVESSPAEAERPPALSSSAALAASAALVSSAFAAPAPALGSLPHASPSIRKLARELGVPLAEVAGSGSKGRITQADVLAFTKQVMAGAVQTQAQGAAAPKAAAGDGAGLNLLPWPKVDFAKFGPVERRELSRIKKISGANLHRNWVMIPHVTNNDEADITELEAFRVSTNKENEKSSVKVTLLAFVIKAVVSALKKFPEFNASLDGDTLVYKQYFNIGFAADTPNGLVVTDQQRGLAGTAALQTCVRQGASPAV